MLPFAFQSCSTDCGFFKTYWTLARQDILWDRVDAVFCKAVVWSQERSTEPRCQGHRWPSNVLGRCWIIFSKPCWHCSRDAGPPRWSACTLTFAETFAEVIHWYRCMLKCAWMPSFQFWKWVFGSYRQEFSHHQSYLHLFILLPLCSRLPWRVLFQSPSVQT